MRKEVSSGGVVVFNNAILLLKKYNGDWVLPKGRVEKDETLPITALREVEEETGVKGTILLYLGKIDYKYNCYKYNEIVSKRVHWYYMRSSTLECRPQKTEGFILARFIHRDKVLELLKYKDERRVVGQALKFIE